MENEMDTFGLQELPKIISRLRNKGPLQKEMRECRCYLRLVRVEGLRVLSLGTWGLGIWDLEFGVYGAGVGPFGDKYCG